MSQLIAQPTINRNSNPVQAFRLVVTLILSLFATLSLVALAAPNAVTFLPTATGVDVRAENGIRFYVDYAARTIMLPEATVAENTSSQVAGEGISLEVRPDGLILHLERAFTLNLSPNGKLLSIAHRVNPNTAQQGDLDARMPTMIYLSNANPTQVASLLTRLYPNLRIEVDERQRALIVLMNPADKPVVEALIKKLDTPRPQVMFEAEIIEINRTLSQQLGIDYTKLINLSFKLIEGTPPTGNLLGFGQFARAPLSLEAGLQLLKSTGAGKTLARPRVATLDGLEARLNATQTQPIKTVGQGGTVSVSNITTGINMRLVPKVAPDQSIESVVNIAVSSPTGFSSEGLPTYSTREANTTVRVKNGEPIVIGGLYENRESTSSQGIPGLMDIPIVGELFKTSYVEQRNTDLLIVVTPYIVSSPSDPVTPQPTGSAASSTPTSSPEPSSPEPQMP